MLQVSVCDASLCVQVLRRDDGVSPPDPGGLQPVRAALAPGESPGLQPALPRGLRAGPLDPLDPLPPGG